VRRCTSLPRPVLLALTQRLAAAAAGPLLGAPMLHDLREMLVELLEELPTARLVPDAPKLREAHPSAAAGSVSGRGGARGGAAARVKLSVCLSGETDGSALVAGAAGGQREVAKPRRSGDKRWPPFSDSKSYLRLSGVEALRNHRCAALVGVQWHCLRRNPLVALLQPCLPELCVDGGLRLRWLSMGVGKLWQFGVWPATVTHTRVTE
jgi:hypothetical protein